MKQEENSILEHVRAALLALMLANGFVVAPASCATPLKPAATLVPALAAGLPHDTTHTCVAPDDFDRFTDSCVATFGGSKSKQVSSR
ncbi:hypothetical protein FCJ57_33030 [Burkholderia diffusa]|nr:hypothetical protein [Burkholderia diffusa]